MRYLSWHVGMKVVCVNGDIIGWRGIDDVLPTEGAIYTIRGIAPWIWGGIDTPTVDGIGVWLEEIRRPLGRHDNGVETPYGVERFQPLCRRKTDISIFTRMLNPQKQDVEA